MKKNVDIDLNPISFACNNSDAQFEYRDCHNNYLNDACMTEWYRFKTQDQVLLIMGNF